MTALLLGPLLRHVGTDSATVWVETATRCVVEISTPTVRAAADTFCVAGHHYALVVVESLPPATASAYEVRLDGHVVWPAPGDDRPPCRIRTLDPEAPFRLLFGSCRYATGAAVSEDPRYDSDALDAYATRLARGEDEAWPDALLLLGDQVYADKTSPQTRRFIAARRDISAPPKEQVADYEEYTRLYYESWRDPAVRWLMASVPTSMIFDDHDVRDDWNTSHEWRLEMQATSWWEERIVGGLMSYWVYQHLGNLSPADLAADETYRRVRAADDGEQILRAFAAAADREADGGKGARWSYRRDFGRTRLLVVDSRCGRILAPGNRSMVSEAEFAWIEEQTRGDYDHLLLGTSLPWLMPRALHDLESWDEALCTGERGRLLAALGEKLRRAADLEHWAAFRNSFDRLATLLADVGRGHHGGTPPATICVLSGDVHHAYVARADYPQPVTSPIFQLTCSPLHNFVPAPMHWAFRVAWSATAERCTRWLLDAFARVPPVPLSWRRLSGPYFGDEIASLVLDGRAARVVFEKAGRSNRGSSALTTVAALALSTPARDTASATASNRPSVRPSTAASGGPVPAG